MRREAFKRERSSRKVHLSRSLYSMTVCFRGSEIQHRN